MLRRHTDDLADIEGLLPRGRPAPRLRWTMIDTLLVVLALAVVDSINPSALVVALYLLSQPSPVPRVLAYVAGIAVTYLWLGVALMLGVGAAVEASGDALDHPIALVLQGLLGAAMLGYAVFAPKTGEMAPEVRMPRAAGLVGMALLGATVTAVELVTAFPYFAAIAVMVAAGLHVSQWLPVLLAYNAIFVSPPLILLGLHLLLGRSVEARFEHLRERLRAGARETMLWLIALVGVALLVDAVGRLMR